MTTPALAFAPRQEWSIVPRRASPQAEPGVLARILYRLRAESGLTQAQVSERAGWKNNSRYSDLERGHIKLPGRETIARLETAFGLAPGTIEDQLPRRDRFMLEAPPEPLDEPIPFPSPHVRRVGEYARQIESLDPKGRTSIGVEVYLAGIIERLLEETAGASDQEDTDEGTIVPTA